MISPPVFDGAGAVVEREVAERAQQEDMRVVGGGRLAILAEGAKVFADRGERARPPRHHRRERQWALVLQQ